MGKENEILRLENARFVYEGEEKAVWEGISCRFYAGKIHLISGSSGCGKSSLLYYIKGLIPYMTAGEAGGEIYYAGENITGLSPAERCDKIALVMQDAESQFCTFTVEDELAFGLESLGLPVPEMKRRIRESLAAVGMEGFEKRDLYSLSGGEMQKLALACALAMSTDLILLDEPTANLDPESAKEVLTLLLHLARQEQKTLIIVEHNPDVIMDEVDYIYCLDKDEGLFLLDKEEWKQRGAAVWGSRLLKPAPVIKNRASSKTLFSVNSVSYRYPQELAADTRSPGLEELRFCVYSGDFLALTGASGAGKTTLLKLLMGRIADYQGEIFFGSENIKRIKKKDFYQKVGLVFQNPEHQFVSNAVDEEMLLSFRQYSVSREEKERLADEALRQYDLYGERKRNPFTLSQGQKRRLSVAVMLPTDKELLILDEPTYGQDAQNRLAMMEEMKRLHEKGLTLIMVTHDLNLVRAYANRVLELREGRLSFDGSTEDYFERG